MNAQANGERKVGAGLSVRDLTVSFGAHVAVDHVNLDSPVGAITALIGPNGAGKTTTFNACNGIQALTEGTVELFGENVTSKPAPHRARLGLGRTFQRVQLCETTTVEANVALGAEARVVGNSPIRQFIASSTQRRTIVDATDEALELCGIADDRDVRVSALSTGQRRLVELARVVAGGFQMLLLDEPSSGLDTDESAGFCSILRRLVDDRGVGVLLVEHDMAVVMSVCEMIYVLDFGRLIFQGRPAEVQASDEVRSAYLGTEALA